MERRKCILWLLLAVLPIPRTLAAITASNVPGPPSAVAAATVLPFRLVKDYLVLVPVWVNGHGPYDMILDTAANVSVLDSQLAVESGVPKEQKADIVDLAGSGSLELSHAVLGFAAREFKAEVVIRDLKEFAPIDRRIHGVLGWNFLSQFNFLIDYVHRRIEVGLVITALENAGERMPYETEEGMLLVAADIPLLSRRKLRMTLDSGVNAVVVFANGLRPELDRSNLWRVSSVTGQGAAVALQVPAFAVGEYLFGATSIAVIDLGTKQENRPGDGVIPLQLFRSIYFNQTEHCVILNPIRPTRFSKSSITRTR